MSVRQRVKRSMRHQQAIDAYNDRVMRDQLLIGDGSHPLDSWHHDVYHGNFEKYHRNRLRGLNRERRRLEERYG